MKDREPVDTRDGWARYGWLMGAIWLVFLFFPGRALVLSETAPWTLALGWAGLAAFAATYLAGFITGMRSPLGECGGLTRAYFWAAVACALLTVPAIGWGTTSFIPFLMSYASYVMSRRWHWAVMAAGVGIVVFEAVFAASRGDTPAWGLLWIVLLMAVVNSVNTWLITRSVRADELRLELATSEERESVARDVHDLLGHSLTVVKLKAELAARLIDADPAAARAELDEIVRLTTEAIAGVRGTVTGLRADGLIEQLGASSAALGTSGITVEVRGSATALSPAQSIPAAWVLREATTNILRHAGASRVIVELAPGTLTVEDDGAGLPGAVVPGAGIPGAGLPGAGISGAGRPGAHAVEPGNGLRGMRERAAAAGAELSFSTGELHGTKVSLTW